MFVENTWETGHCITILQVSVLNEDAAKILPQSNNPRIGQFIVDNGEPFYYIFVEQRVLLQCQSSNCLKPSCCGLWSSIFSTWHIISTTRIWGLLFSNMF